MKKLFRGIKVSLCSFLNAQRQKNEQIRVYNWWSQSIQDNWLINFIKSRNLLPSQQYLSLGSVFGYPNVMKYAVGKRIFFTGENVHTQSYLMYSDYLLNKGWSDLSIGFDFFDHNKYIRFPLWLMYMFPPDSKKSEIKKICDSLMYPNVSNKSKFASLVSRYDLSGLRSEMYESLSSIDIVSCPSDVCHNDDTLRTDYYDDKISYLRQFRYNICPENTNCMGYVTEKVFQAIEAGCIPIYWGSYNMPEYGVLNQETILFWNKDKDNTKLVSSIREMEDNPKLFFDFASQPRLNAFAADRIDELFCSLEGQIRNLMYD